MRSRLRITICLFCLCPLITVSDSNAKDLKDFGEVEILRDTWGIPHVFSDTDEGAFYGLGYATAEDRAFQMVYSLRIIQGRLAETIGNVPAMNRKKGAALDLDKKMRIIGFYRAAKETAKNLDHESISFLQAYCDGVNDYMAAHSDDLLYLFKKLELEIEPWTPADCIASWWHMAKFFSGEGLHDTMVYHRKKEGTDPRTRMARGGRGRGSRGRNTGRPVAPVVPPVDDAAAVVQREDVTDQWLKQVESFLKEHQLESLGKDRDDPNGPKFSHAWVVGGKNNSTGSAVLCSDPQTPVRNPSMFYEYHISGKTFNVRGIGVPGSPVILIGFTKDVAWGMTALGADQADQFMLKTDSDHPNQYEFDGEWRDFHTWTETIKVKDAESCAIELKESHLGPVVSDIAHDVRQGEEVALKRIPICDTDCETIQGFIEMSRAKNVYDFSKSFEKWRFPTANIVFGDKEGNIGYWTLGAIPIRSRYALDWGNATHDGSMSKYDWEGIVPYDLMPHTINPKRGYLHSGNHRAIGSFYPPLLGPRTGANGDSTRSWRLRERLEMKDRFTPEEVLDIHFDTVNPAKREIVRIGYHLRDTQKATLSEATLKALNHLEEWWESGAKSDLSIKGTELVNQIPIMFRQNVSDLTLVYGGGNSGLCYFLKTAKKRLDENPNTVFNEDEIEFIDSTLAGGWRNAERLGRDPDNWLSQARKNVQNRTLGYFESLDGFPSVDREYDVKYANLACDDGGTVFSQAAQSYSQWVPLNDIDRAKSILPVGLSEHPDSPYRMSAYETWATGQMHPAPLGREAVEKIMADSVVISD